MRIVCAFTTLFLACAPGPSYANGALAIDTNQGSGFGYSFGYASQRQADLRAVQECNANGCHVVVQFSHACAAYAADQAPGSTAYGWGAYAPGVVGGSGENRAKRRAISECVAHGGKSAKCIIRVWGCEP